MEINVYNPGSVVFAKPTARSAMFRDKSEGRVHNHKKARRQRERVQKLIAGRVQAGDFRGRENLVSSQSFAPCWRQNIYLGIGLFSLHLKSFACRLL